LRLHPLYWMHRITRWLLAAGGCQVQEEEGLVRRAQQQDQAALSEIFETYFDRLYRYVVLRIGDRAEAEDVTQQVFMKVLRSLPGYRWTGTPFSAWLFRIARNLVIDYHRSQRRTRELSREIVDSGEGMDPVQMAEDSLTLDEVSRVFPMLTKLQQEVLQLRFAGELSVAEAARAMGKTDGAVKALQHSAVNALRRILGEDSKRANHGQEDRAGLRGVPGAPGIGREPGAVS
jgi:RNA polymerase sigma-70 factor, ECF subfamily